MPLLDRSYWSSDKSYARWTLMERKEPNPRAGLKDPSHLGIDAQRANAGLVIQSNVALQLAIKSQCEARGDEKDAVSAGWHTKYSRRSYCVWLNL